MGGPIHLAPPFRFSGLRAGARLCATSAGRLASPTIATLPPAFGHFRSFMMRRNEAALRRIGNRRKE